MSKHVLKKACVAIAAFASTFASYTAQAENKSVVANAAAAEFVVVTSDNRLFVAASDGLYYVPRNGGSPSKVPVALDATSTPSTSTTCYFGAMSQMGNLLYADCSTFTSTGSISRNYLLAMDLTANTGMRAFYSAADGVFYNGMTTDGKGNIYVSVFPTSGSSSGRIDKFALGTPTSVLSRTAWLTTSGKPNGLQVSGNTLYWSEDPLTFGTTPSYLRKVAITSSGTPGAIQTIYQVDASIVMDDFILVSDGILLTTASSFALPLSPANQVLHLSETGQVLHKNAIPFTLPSAVFLETSPNPGAIYVTERGNPLISGSGDVTEYFQSWNLSPRK